MPRLRPILVVLLLLGATPPAAAATLHGRVHDANGTPLAQVDVVVVDLQREVVTGADGAFHLETLPDGAHTLLFYRAGYAYHSEDVTLPGAGELTVSLPASSATLPPVVVTATRRPRPTLASPLPTAFLSGEALRTQTSLSLAHALEDLPGLRTVSTGAQIGKPMIRGMTGARVLVLDDGHRVDDYSWSDEDGPSIDPVLAERVEVVRGPASVLYGADAIGGVANVIAPALLTADRGESVWQGRLSTHVGSNSREGGGALTLEGARGTLGWRVAGAGRFAEALHTPDGELENTGFAAFTGDAALGLRGERGALSLRVAQYGGEFKLLEAGGQSVSEGTAEEEGPERKANDQRVQLDGEWSAGDTRLEAKLQWQRHSLIELSDEAPADSSAGLREKKEQEAFNLLLNTVSLDLLAQHRLGRRIHGTAGVSGTVQSNDTRGPIPLVPDASALGAAVFVFEEARLGDWSLLGGVRADHQTISADANADLDLAADDRDWSQISGDAGVVFRPLRALAFSANAGLAWRAPTLFELYANGPQIAEARYLLGDATLAAERALDLDLGVRWESPRVRAEASLYWNRVDDFVGLYPTADSLAALRVWEYRGTDATLSGAELGLHGQVTPLLGLGGRVDLVRGQDENAGAPLPLIPSLRGALSADLTWSTLSWARRARLAVELEMVADKDRLAPEETRTGGYSLLGGEAGVERAAFGRDWDLRLRVSNALNRRYRDFLSRYKDFADNPGVDLSLRLATTF